LLRRLRHMTTACGARTSRLDYRAARIDDSPYRDSAVLVRDRPAREGLAHSNTGSRSTPRHSLHPSGPRPNRIRSRSDELAAGFWPRNVTAFIVRLGAAFAVYAETHSSASIRRFWSTWNTLCTFLYTAELLDSWRRGREPGAG
jgi:hypothetical protein